MPQHGPEYGLVNFDHQVIGPDARIGAGELGQASFEHLHTSHPFLTQLDLPVGSRLGAERAVEFGDELSVMSLAGR
jgi:hypothetical protein